MDLHACPGDRTPKKYEVSKDIFAEADLETIESDINEQQDSQTKKGSIREKTRTTTQPLYAFRKNKKDQTIYRLGGSYGKLAGLFKDIGKMLYGQKEEGFKVGYKSFLKSLIIRPQWIILEDSEEIIIDKLPQITSGRNKALIILYYETIPKCKANLTVILPDKEEARFKKILENCEGIPFAPKRRAEIKILNTNWV